VREAFDLERDPDEIGRCLGLNKKMRALEEHSHRTIERMKPWRSYAAMLFWRKAGAVKTLD
jgi:3-methyladenine DNA glycosylase/8-oxoguanine DNA glycosylase